MSSDFTAAGWEIEMFTAKRKSVELRPVPPCRTPDPINYERPWAQQFFVTADYDTGEQYARGIVAMCRETWVHTPEERRQFVENVAALCDIRLGEHRD